MASIYQYFTDTFREELTKEKYISNLSSPLMDKMKDFDLEKQYQIIIGQNKEELTRFCFDMLDEKLPEVDDVLVRDFIRNFNKSSFHYTHFIEKCERMLSPDYFLDFDEIIIFGCPLSTDIDVAVLCKNLKHLHKPINMKKLRNILTSLSYDVNREIDPVTILIENNKVVDFSKGGRELHNIILETYHHHNQMTPLPLYEPIPVDLVDLIRSCAKYILDNLKYLSNETHYKSVRVEKNRAYEGNWERVDFALSQLKYLKYSENSLTKSKFKSLIMKICQLILFNNGIFRYTKLEIAYGFRSSVNFALKREGILWYLTRGEMGIYYENTLPILFERFRKLCEKYKPDDIQWIDIDIDTSKNPTELPDFLYREFLESPLECTETFSREFRKLHNRKDGINLMFKIRCENEHLCPEFLRDKIYFVDQRSEEWLSLKDFHVCGRNSGIEECNQEDWVSFFYNLIRGCIGELMVINNVDFSFIGEKMVVGMMTEKKVKGSFAFSPDLLLVTKEKEIIPVEIKCAPYEPKDNSEMRSKYKLAKLELESAAKITKSKRGIVFFIHMYNGKIQCRYSWIPL